MVEVVDPDQAEWQKDSHVVTTSVLRRRFDAHLSDDDPDVDWTCERTLPICRSLLQTCEKHVLEEDVLHNLDMSMYLPEPLAICSLLDGEYAAHPCCSNLLCTQGMASAICCSLIVHREVGTNDHHQHKHQFLHKGMLSRLPLCSASTQDFAVLYCCRLCGRS